MSNFYFKFFSGWWLFFLSITSLNASATRDLFLAYPNFYFVETGSYLGEGIQMALDAGFPVIHSIELSPILHAQCLERFKDFPQVHLWQGDSALILPLLLKQLKQPATFWLDGHYSHGMTARGKHNTPLLAELQAIENHFIKTHTILIDDVRCFDQAIFDFLPLKKVLQKLKSINPSYFITYKPGSCPQDILIATPAH